MTRRRKRRRRQLLFDLKEERRYWNLKHEALDRTLWRTPLDKTVDLSQDRLRSTHVRKLLCRAKGRMTTENASEQSVEGNI